MTEFGVGIQGGKITNEVNAFNTLIAPSGRAVQVVRRYRNWSDDLFDSAAWDAINAGRKPFFVPHAFDPGSVSILWADIARRKYDTRLRAWCQELKDAGYPPSWFVWHHEPDDEVFGTADGSGQGRCGTPADFAASWLHVYHLMRNFGVPETTQIGVCLMGGTFRARNRNPAEFITDKVSSLTDFIASDGYSRSEKSGQKEKSFVDTFGPAHDFAVARGKPFVIEECGVSELVADPNYKANWFKNAIPYVQAWKPALLEYSEVIAENFGGQDYRFETSPQSLSSALELCKQLP